eukprot:6193299-Heterocapsa_arctica.AAC.1
MTRMFHTSKDLMASTMLDAKLREGPRPVDRLTRTGRQARLRRARATGAALAAHPLKDALSHS